MDLFNLFKYIIDELNNYIININKIGDAIDGKSLIVLNKHPFKLSYKIESKLIINKFFSKYSHNLFSTSKLPDEKKARCKIFNPNGEGAFDAYNKGEPYLNKPSVNQITDKISAPNNNIRDYNLIYYKTFGDLGQILSFKDMTNSLEGFSFFYTFDRICGYIGSIFNPYTLLEDSQIITMPFKFFVPKEMVYPSANSRFGKSLQLQFGKKTNKEKLKKTNKEKLKKTNKEKLKKTNKEKLKKTNKEKLKKTNKEKLKKTNKEKLKKTNKEKLKKTNKEKLKKTNKEKLKKTNKEKLKKTNKEKLKKISLKYRIPFDKNIYKNLKRVLKIHELAKKLRIRLTKKNKKNIRVYRTPNEIMKDINKKKNNIKKLNK